MHQHHLKSRNVSVLTLGEGTDRKSIPEESRGFLQDTRNSTSREEELSVVISLKTCNLGREISKLKEKTFAGFYDRRKISRVQYSSPGDLSRDKISFD